MRKGSPETRVAIDISRSGSNQTNTVSDTASSNSQSKLSVKLLGELIDDFKGSENIFKKWKRQVELVIATYELNNNAVKILISTKLKGKTLR